VSHIATEHEKKSELLPIVFPAKFLLNTCTWKKKETFSISLVLTASGLVALVPVGCKRETGKGQDGQHRSQGLRRLTSFFKGERNGLF
jgi:hypothetical protein